MPVDKSFALERLSFGQRVAEEELTELARYFVQTDQWRQLFAGQADIVYGHKGAGKSALYAALVGRQAELEARGILLVTGENPRGTPVFRDLVEDPPTSEQEFRYLWKIYLLQLVGQKLRDNVKQELGVSILVKQLEEAGLLPREGGLKALVRSALEYVRRFTRPSGIEGTIKLDPITGLPSGLTGRISFREPGAGARAAGVESVDALFGLADRALSSLGRSVWILLDRLDVAFAESLDLEQNALRALFVAYSDLRPHTHVVPKIFLRTDIWDRITKVGFREASHITRTLTIEWDRMSLMNLVVQRMVQSHEVCNLYEARPGEVLANAAAQEALFYRVFPAQVDVGSRRPTTFDWILSRTQDGFKHTAPRELIHLLSEARNSQLRRKEVGEALPEGDVLIGGTALKQALGEVSRVRLTQTLFAEYPNLAPHVNKLRGGKTLYTVGALAEVWRQSDARALDIANQLNEVGFFEGRGTRDAPEFWIPFLYRDGLDLVQGAAE